LKAFIGEPADQHGNAVPCASCDRRARSLVSGEPRCALHEFDTPPAALRNQAEASRRARRRQQERGND
jgi:hypothetical protein